MRIDACLCPNCGANLIITPSSMLGYCEYCNSQYQISDGQLNGVCNPLVIAQMRRLVVPICEYEKEKQMLDALENHYNNLMKMPPDNSSGSAILWALCVGFFLCMISPILGIIVGIVLFVSISNSVKAKSQAEHQNDIDRAKAKVDAQKEMLDKYQAMIDENDGNDIPTRFRDQKSMNGLVHLLETGQAISKKEAYLLYAKKAEEEEQRKREEDERKRNESRKGTFYSQTSFTDPFPQSSDTAQKVASTVAKGVAVVGATIVAKALFKGIFKL